MCREMASVVILVILVAASAFAIVGIKHLNRMSSMELQALLDERDELDIEWKRLQLGADTFGTLSRVENFAGKNLNMVIPAHEQIINIVVHE